MKKLLLIAIIPILGLLSCKKESSTNNNQSVIEIYLLKSFKKIDNSARISNDSIILSDTALIKNSEILSYDKTNFTFTVSENKAKWLNNFELNKSHGKAFAVTIDKNVIYTGYFWASFSSSMVDWIVIDPLNYSGGNKLAVKLGYPGLAPQMIIPDLRNDKRLIDLLSLTNRLKE